MGQGLNKFQLCIYIFFNQDISDIFLPVKKICLRLGKVFSLNTFFISKLTQGNSSRSRAADNIKLAGIRPKLAAKCGFKNPSEKA